ncbi:hypothetical protein MTHERMMSTA1_04860 [Methanosarcina thermophila MST-A1]|jgi:hypothetical protein|uniref:Surface antigen protein n=1 Tax=Methanosarcina thermophila TaxID=2210 RepID=A0A3G9CZJ2_METTE|nr:hypothetical protein [Methanosarcina thermophila]BAW30479.1 surface antigen protein [Methanosarcina thermophila]GLI13360.1 hypothetical protein MTHERMMSTA1_04860 [Methanosarcina thermophila MST-A1]HOA68345.1 hypothetical protein [Methanosarcina thermophila]HOQ64945.1 hypothetical protein [Methanosarcina thermophila]HPT80237.1 hypothetical protein [Methanosarcina thermophila]
MKDITSNKIFREHILIKALGVILLALLMLMGIADATQDADIADATQNVDVQV